MFDDDFDGDVGAVLFEEFAEDLALGEVGLVGFTSDDVSYHF